MINFFQYIQSKVSLTPAITTSLSRVCKTEQLPKNYLFIKEESAVHRLYFLESGVARSFYYHDGKDVTSWFYTEGQLVTSWGSFFARQASQENIELLEDAVVTSINYNDLQLLYQQYPAFSTFGRLLVEEQIIFLDFFYKGFMFMTAREKYDLLLSYFPDVVLRVNLGHIASFLGITQETLSRIRKKK